MKSIFDRVKKRLTGSGAGGGHLFQKRYKPGEEREGEEGEGAVILRGETLHDSMQEIFFATRAYNRRADDGELYTDAPKHQYVFPESCSIECNASFPLSSEDIRTQEEIFLPCPMYTQHEKGRVESGRYKTITFAPLTPRICDKKGKNLIDPRELRNCVYKDDIGNYTIQLPLHLRRSITKDCVLRCYYVKEVHLQEKLDASLLTPKQTNTKTDQYPLRIQQLMQVIQSHRTRIKNKKNGKSWKEENDEVALQILSGFLGNMWLRYNRLDANPRDRDIPNLTQTERVLRQKQASCEGVHIALQEIFDAIADENEGSILMTGIQCRPKYGKISARSNNFHGKLYLQTVNDYYIIDATPWDKYRHEHMRRAITLRQRLTREWFDTRDKIFAERKREGKMIVDNSKAILDRIRDLEERIGSYWESSKNCSMQKYLKFKEHVDDSHGWNQVLQLPVLPGQRKTVPSSETLVPSNIMKPLLDREDYRLSSYLSSGNTSAIYGYFSLHLPKIRLLQGKKDEEPSTQLTELQEGFFSPWKGVKKKLGQLFAEAQEASVQNIHAIEYLNEKMELETKVCRRRLQDMLQQALSLRSEELEKFWKHAPWMTLVQCPDIYHFFSRSYEKKSKSFLSPGSPGDIDEKWEKLLESCRATQEKNFAAIAQALQHLPKQQQTKDPIKFPALALIKRTRSESGVKTQDNTPSHDPISIFQHLAKAVEQDMG